MKQLGHADSPPLYYAFVVRLEKEWGEFIVVSRAQLHELWNNGCGSENNVSGDLELYIQFRLNEGETPKSLRKFDAKCGVYDFTPYINAWEGLPPLRPPAPIHDSENAGIIGEEPQAGEWPGEPVVD